MCFAVISAKIREPVISGVDKFAPVGVGVQMGGGRYFAGTQVARLGLGQWGLLLRGQVAGGRWSWGDVVRGSSADGMRWSDDQGQIAVSKFSLGLRQLDWD